MVAFGGGSRAKTTHSNAALGVLGKGLDILGAPSRAVQRVFLAPVREILDAVDSDPATKFSLGEMASSMLSLPGSQDATARALFDTQPLLKGLDPSFKIFTTLGVDIVSDPTIWLGLGAFKPVTAAAEGAKVGLAAKVARAAEKGMWERRTLEALSGAGAEVGSVAASSEAAALGRTMGLAEAAKVAPDAAAATGYTSALTLKVPFSRGNVIPIPGTEKIGAFISTAAGKIKAPVIKVLDRIPAKYQIGREAPLLRKAALADVAEPAIAKDMVRMYRVGGGEWFPSRIAAVRNSAVHPDDVVEFADVAGDTARTLAAGGALPSGVTTATMEIPQNVRKAYVAIDTKRVFDGVVAGAAARLLNESEKISKEIVPDAKNFVYHLDSQADFGAALLLNPDSMERGVLDIALQRVADSMQEMNVPQDIIEGWLTHANDQILTYAQQLADDPKFLQQARKAGQGLIWKMNLEGNRAGTIEAMVFLQGRLKDASELARGFVPYGASAELDSLINTSKDMVAAARYAEKNPVTGSSRKDEIRTLFNLFERATGDSASAVAARRILDAMGTSPVKEEGYAKMVAGAADRLKTAESNTAAAAADMAAADAKLAEWTAFHQELASGAPMSDHMQEWLYRQFNDGEVGLDTYRRLGGDDVRLADEIAPAEARQMAEDRLGTADDYVARKIQNLQDRVSQARVRADEAKQTVADTQSALDEAKQFLDGEYGDFAKIYDQARATVGSDNRDAILNEMANIISTTAKQGNKDGKILDALRTVGLVDRAVKGKSSGGLLAKIYTDWEQAMAGIDALAPDEAAKLLASNPFQSMRDALADPAQVEKIVRKVAQRAGVSADEARPVIQQGLDALAPRLDQAATDFASGWRLERTATGGVKWGDVTRPLTQRAMEASDALAQVPFDADIQSQMIDSLLEARKVVDDASATAEVAQTAAKSAEHTAKKWEKTQVTPGQLKIWRDEHALALEKHADALVEASKVKSAQAVERKAEFDKVQSELIDKVLGRYQQKQMTAAQKVADLTDQEEKIRKAYGTALAKQEAFNNHIGLLQSLEERMLRQLDVNIAWQQEDLLKSMQRLGVTMNTAGDADASFHLAINALDEIQQHLFQAATGMEFVERGGIGVRLPKDMKSFIFPQRTMEDMQEFSKVTKLWRASAVLKPGFSNRNFIGAWINNKMQGIVFEHYEDAVRIANALKNDAPIPEAILKKYGMTQEMLSEALATVVRSDQIAGSITAGANLFGRGQGLMEGASQYLDQHAMAKQAYMRLMSFGDADLVREAGQLGVEPVVRMANYLGVRSQGLTHMEAIDRVFAVHFNYADLSAFDKRIRKYVPFWTFRSRNLMLQAQLFVHQPEAMRAMIMAREDLRKMGSDNLPPWLSGLALPWGDKVLDLNNYLPAGDALAVGDALSLIPSNPARAFPTLGAQMLGGPQITIAEILFNKDLFTQKELMDRTKSGPAQLKQTAETLVRMFGVPDEVWRAAANATADTSKSTKIMKLVDLAGITPKFRNYTPQ